MLFLIPFLMAHPMSGANLLADPASATLGMRTHMQVYNDHVDLTFIVEIPLARLALESNESPEATRLQALQDGLWLRLDQERLPLSPLPVEKPIHPSPEAGMAEMEVHLQATLPHSSGELTLENGAYPLDRALYATTVEIDGSLVVLQTSLLNVEDGKLRNNRNGAWISDEDARRTQLQIRPATLFERSQGLSAIGERMEGRLSNPWPRLGMALATILVFGWALFGRKAP